MWPALIVILAGGAVALRSVSIAFRAPVCIR